MRSKIIGKKKIMWDFCEISNEPIPHLILSETRCFVEYLSKSLSSGGPIKKRRSKEGLFESFELAKKRQMDLFDAKIRSYEAHLHVLREKKQKIKNTKQPEIPGWMK